MNLEQMKARLAEIDEKLAAFEGISEFTDEQTTEINSLSDEAEKLCASIDTAEKIANRRTKISQPQRKVEAKQPQTEVEVKDKHKATGGFESYGDLAIAVYNKDVHNEVDDRFKNSTLFESVGEDGGVTVPKEFMTEVQEKFKAQDSLLSRTSQFSVSGNSLSMPVDEEQPWNGGTTAYWTAEGSRITKSKGRLSEAEFKLRKLAVLTNVNDELLDDSQAIESILRTKAPAAMVAAVNNAIIDGDGAGKPTGILQSGFTFDVAAEGSQAADTIVYENLIKMESRLIPGSNAVWLAHPEVKEQLRQVVDGNGNLIYLNGAQFPNVAERPFDTVLGKPIIYMPGAMKALGDRGDLILADLSYYYALVKAGVKQSMSTHLNFDRDQTAFKFTMRMDGHCPFKEPVTTENGDYKMSGFVTLAAR